MCQLTPQEKLLVETKYNDYSTLWKKFNSIQRENEKKVVDQFAQTLRELILLTSVLLTISLAAFGSLSDKIDIILPLFIVGIAISIAVLIFEFLILIRIHEDGYKDVVDFSNNSINPVHDITFESSQAIQGKISFDDWLKADRAYIDSLLPLMKKSEQRIHHKDTRSYYIITAIVIGLILVMLSVLIPYEGGNKRNNSQHQERNRKEFRYHLPR